MSIPSARSARTRKKTTFEKYTLYVETIGINSALISRERLVDAKDELERLWRDLKDQHAVVVNLLTERNEEDPEIMTLSGAFYDAQDKYWKQKALFFDAIQAKNDDRAKTEALDKVEAKKLVKEATATKTVAETATKNVAETATENVAEDTTDLGYPVVVEAAAKAAKENAAEKSAAKKVDEEASAKKAAEEAAPKKIEKANSPNSRGLASAMASPCGNRTPSDGEKIVYKESNKSIKTEPSNEPVYDAAQSNVRDEMNSIDTEDENIAENDETTLDKLMKEYSEEECEDEPENVPSEESQEEECALHLKDKKYRVAVEPKAASDVNEFEGSGAGEFERSTAKDHKLRHTIQNDKKEHFVLNSEYPTSLLVVVPLVNTQNWNIKYERPTDTIMPGSSQLIHPDQDHALVMVCLFHKVVDDVKNESYAQPVEGLGSCMEERDYKQIALVHHEHFDPGNLNSLLMEPLFTDYGKKEVGINIAPNLDAKTLVKQESYSQPVEELNSRMEECKGKLPDNYKQMVIMHHEYKVGAIPAPTTIPTLEQKCQETQSLQMTLTNKNKEFKSSVSKLNIQLSEVQRKLNNMKKNQACIVPPDDHDQKAEVNLKFLVESPQDVLQTCREMVDRNAKFENQDFGEIEITYDEIKMEDSPALVPSQNAVLTTNQVVIPANKSIKIEGLTAQIDQISNQKMSNERNENPSTNLCVPTVKFENLTLQAPKTKTDLEQNIENLVSNHTSTDLLSLSLGHQVILEGKRRAPEGVVPPTGNLPATETLNAEMSKSMIQETQQMLKYSDKLSTEFAAAVEPQVLSHIIECKPKEGIGVVEGTSYKKHLLSITLVHHEHFDPGGIDSLLVEPLFKDYDKSREVDDSVIIAKRMGYCLHYETFLGGILHVMDRLPPDKLMLGSHLYAEIITAVVKLKDQLGVALTYHVHLVPGDPSPFHGQDGYTKEETEETHGHQERASSGLNLNSRLCLSLGGNEATPKKVDQAVIPSGRGSVWKEELGRAHPQEKAGRKPTQEITEPLLSFLK